MKHKQLVIGAVFSSDQSSILSWSRDGTARLWDTQSTQPLGQPMRHKHNILGASYSPDQSHVITWSIDGTMRLWDTKTIQPIGQPILHNEPVRRAIFSPDKMHILSWTVYGTAYLWNNIWTSNSLSRDELVAKACEEKLIGNEIRVISPITGKPVMKGPRRINVQLSHILPALPVQEGEDICNW